MAQKIYVVESASGVYEDYRCWNEKAFINKEEAEAYAKELDEKHRAKPQFVNDEFEKAYSECYDSLPEWGEGPDLRKDENAYFKWLKDCEKKDREYIIAEMYKKGFFLTEEMIEQYEKYEADSYEDWHDCRVEELELI